MTPMPLVTAPVGIGTEDAAALLAKHKIEKLPLVDSQGRLRGADHGQGLREGREVPERHQGRQRVGCASPPRSGSTATRGTARPPSSTPGVDVLVADTAHGHARMLLDMVRRLKSDPATRGVQVIGGNVATRAGAQALVDAGVDAVKVGVGPGSICTTRVVAGVGVPQITAIYEAARRASRRVCRSSATAGCSTPATSPRHSWPVPTRSCSARCSPAARRARATSCSSTASSSSTIAAWARSARWLRAVGRRTPRTATSRRTSASDDLIVPEGIEGQVPYRGPLRAVAHQLIGGLHQSMFYVGAGSIPELQERGTFVRITSAGLKESHPHDIQMTVEAPNYHR